MFSCGPRDYSGAIGSGGLFVDPVVDAIPEYLRDRDFWLVGRRISRSSGRLSKAYCRLDYASLVDLTDRSALLSFDSALAVLRDRCRGLEYLGYNVGLDPDVIGVDRDQCWSTFNPEPDDECSDPDHGHPRLWVEQSRDQFPTYTEVSLSGTGEHAFGRARKSNFVDFNGKPITVQTFGNLGSDKTGKVEVFVGFGALTVTGRRVNDMPDGVFNVDEGLEACISCKKSVSYSDYAKIVSDKDPSWVAMKACQEKFKPSWSKVTSGELFRRIFLEGERGLYSHDLSSEDFYIAQKLAYYAGPDSDLIEHVMRNMSHPGFRREKWDEKRKNETWLRSDIERALKGRGPNDYHFTIVDKVKSNGKTCGVKEIVNDTIERRGLISIESPTSDEIHPEGDNARPDDDDTRIEVEITTREDDVLNKSLNALAFDNEVYRRGNVLVTVTAQDKKDVSLTKSSILRGIDGAPRVIPLSAASIRCRMSAMAKFIEYREDRHGELVKRERHPPEWLVTAVHTHSDYSRLRPLVSVAECPYVRSDGTLADTDGYDMGTGVLSRSSVRVRVPDNPTQDDARRAAERIFSSVSQFPFGDDNDRAVLLAGLLTAVNRPAIDGPTPGIAITGNVAGIGKGLLIDWVSCIATGRPAPTTSYPRDSEEANKVKIAIALSGSLIVHFDNLEEGSVYGNSALDSAITSIVVTERLLGQSKMSGVVPLRVAWFLTGNNVHPGKDAYRRWLPCKLISPLECPEEREDLLISDLRSYTIEHRSDLLEDALTILRAHIVAGRPMTSRSLLGSFEVWDQIIRGAVYYATGQDPCKSRRDAAKDSPERLGKIALISGWRSLPHGSDGCRGHTATEARNYVERNPGSFPVLHEALVNLSKDGHLPSSKSIGRYMASLKDTPIGGLKVTQVGVQQHTILWRIDKVDRSPNGNID